jgi:hypothetical protein
VLEGRSLLTGDIRKLLGSNIFYFHDPAMSDPLLLCVEYMGVPIHAYTKEGINTMWKLERIPCQPASMFHIRYIDRSAHIETSRYVLKDSEDHTYIPFDINDK